MLLFTPYCVIINMPRFQTISNKQKYLSKTEKMINLPKKYYKLNKTEKQRNLPGPRR